MPKDRIVLDVGGTKFVTLKKTLTAWTSAFDVSEDTLFIDADPDAFSVLLSFMRNGSVHPRSSYRGSLETSHLLSSGWPCESGANHGLDHAQCARKANRNFQEITQWSIPAIFENKLETTWALEQGPFINQDPVAFSVLLEFMTRGHLEQSKLTNEVLELAEVLGVESLVNAVKARTCWVGNDEESILKFNDMYTSISNAICHMSEVPSLTNNTNMHLPHVSNMRPSISTNAVRRLEHHYDYPFEHVSMAMSVQNC